MREIDDPVRAAAAIVHIQQLAIRYAVGVDMRDLDLVAEQFVPDVDAGRFGTGREALKRQYAFGDSSMGVTIHRVTNHMVDLVDDDHATGVVYLTADHQLHDGSWAVLVGAYHDTYERIDGRWYIRARKLLFWYRDADALPPTTRRATNYRVFSNWPTLPDAWETWHRFWALPGVQPHVHPSVERSMREGS